MNEKKDIPVETAEDNSDTVHLPACAAKIIFRLTVIIDLSSLC